jgi:hypothetical protein
MYNDVFYYSLCVVLVVFDPNMAQVPVVPVM